MKKIKVMIAGLPGKMASLVAEYVAGSNDMKLALYGLSEKNGEMKASRRIDLVAPSRHKTAIESVKPDIIVDFNYPGSIRRMGTR